MLSYVLILCTVPLPPGVNPIAVDKYIYIYLYDGTFGGGRGCFPVKVTLWLDVFRKKWRCGIMVFVQTLGVAGFFPNKVK